MSEGIAALLGAIVGGGLVVLGDLIARRVEAARMSKRELREAVAELLSYEWHRHMSAAYRREHQSEEVEDDFWSTMGRDRRLAASRIAVNPLSREVLPHAEELIERTNKLVYIGVHEDEEGWETSRTSYMEAVRRLQAATRQLG